MDAMLRSPTTSVATLCAQQSWTMSTRVVSLMQAQTIDEAIELVNATSYGNMACLFTSSGAAARKFRYEAQAGNIGINIGVAAPMAFFPFSGWKESFFGNMHAQGRDAIEFYTEKKVVVE